MSTTSTANGRRARSTKAAADVKATAGMEKPASKPGESVALDLDSLEREDRREPFTFLHGGRVYEIIDPRDMDWQEQLRGMGDPIYFLQHAMSSDDVKAFFETKTPAWKLDRITRAYQEHFGMPSLGE